MRRAQAAIRLAVQQRLQARRSSRIAALLADGVGRVTAGRVARPLGSGARGLVVVVGGTGLGGSGRTAVVQWIAARALARGRRVAVVGHGYRAVRTGRVVLPADPALGDDACLLATALPGAWVETGPRASVAARLAQSHDLVLTDGGLLDPAVRADRVLAVHDCTAPAAVVPAGWARVALSRLPAGVELWAHRVDEPAASIPGGAEVRSVVTATAVRAPGGARLPLSWLAGRRVRPACAVGRPGSFLNTLAELGARLEAPLLAADHHRFTVAERPRDASSPWIVTTKDAAHWPPGWPVYVLETSLTVSGRPPRGWFWP